MKLIARIINVVALIVLVITIIACLYILHAAASYRFLYAFLSINAGTLIVFLLMSFAEWLRFLSKKKQLLHDENSGLSRINAKTMVPSV